MKIDYEELQIAMTSHDPMGMGQFYFDTQTGEVLLVSDWVEDQARPFADPTAIEDEWIRLAWYVLCNKGEIGTEQQEATIDADAYLQRFLVVPQAQSSESYQDMQDFTDSVQNDRLHDRLQTALNGRKPFRKFKDVLAYYPNDHERWFTFSSQRWQVRVDEWLQAEGVLTDGK